MHYEETLLVVSIDTTSRGVCLELSAVGNLHLGTGGTRGAADRLDGADDIHALDDTAKDAVLAVQPASLSGAEEELRAVGVGTRVGHGENARTRVLQLKVLVGKLVAVDGLASRSVVVGEVTSLTHEPRNDTVEGAALVAKALLAGAEGTKVLGRLGDDVGAEFHHDAACGLAADGDVEVALGVGPGWVGSE